MRLVLVAGAGAAMIRRREVLLLGGGAVAAALSGCGGTLAGRPGSTGALLRSRIPLPRPFTVPLPVPATARPSGGGRGEPTAYVLHAKRAAQEVLPGRRTEILGYDATFPGPTIRARSGEPVTVTVRNESGVPTVLHLHGGKTPPGDDGYPTELVATGSERRYNYPLRQRAAPLWYHDHAMDFTGPNVYAGLAGMFVIGDAEDEATGLPTGERDLPLVICDRSFDEDAQFAYPLLDPTRRHPGVEARYHGGLLGDCILVNGAPWPVHEVDAARYRFRILNASNARRLQLTLDSGMTFTQVGTDLGLLERPVEQGSLTLAGAERVDVVVDFADVPVGTRVTMRNALDSGGPGQVMQFHVVRRGVDDSRIPKRLSVIEPIDPSAVSVVRDLHFALGPSGQGGQGGHSHGGAGALWSVNGITFASGRDIARPRLGTIERWRLTTDVHHPVHAHLLGFQIDAGNSDGRNLGWKDTIDLLPGSAREVLVPIEGYAGRYVLHCHNLEHEDMMMMVHFTVLA